MATKEEIAKMTTQQKLDALPRALAKTMKKFLKGEAVDVRISLAIPKLDKDGKPQANFRQDLADALADDELEDIDLKNNIYKRKQHPGSKIREMIESLGINTDQMVAGLEKELERMPDSVNKEKTRRMFAIRRELQELDKKRNALIEELQAI